MQISGRVYVCVCVCVTYTHTHTDTLQGSRCTLACSWLVLSQTFGRISFFFLQVAQRPKVPAVCFPNTNKSLIKSRRLHNICTTINNPVCTLEVRLISLFRQRVSDGIFGPQVPTAPATSPAPRASSSRRASQTSTLTTWSAPSSSSCHPAWT